MTPPHPDDPRIWIYNDVAEDTLWALEYITEWLDYTDAETIDNLTRFAHNTGNTGNCAENLRATITRTARNIRQQLATGAAID